MRILLVEDEPAAAQMAAKGLREQTYAVDVAGDGEAALYQASINDYDLILLDLNLPGKDGLEVCRELRASFRHKRAVPHGFQPYRPVAGRKRQFHRRQNQASGLAHQSEPPSVAGG